MIVTRRGFLGASASAMAGLNTVPGNALAGAISLSRNTAAARWMPPKSTLSELPALMHLAGLPGLSIAVVDNGAVAWTSHFGVSNASTKAPIDDQTLFEAASISKAVFAYAVLQLVDQKKLDLDTPLASIHLPPYLPDIPFIREITARHVLTHSTGLPNWGDEKDPKSFIPAFKPGTFFGYSGEGFFWLQLVVEQLTGLGLSAFMRQQLFEPAGMLRSSFIGDAELATRSAFGHQGGVVARDQGWRNVLPMILPFAEKWSRPIRDWSNADWVNAGKELVPNNPPPRVRFQNAAASMLTTATDYATFLTLVMERTRRSAWEISENTRRAAVAPQMTVLPGGGLSWGLGWAVQRTSDGRRVSHEGNNDDRFTSYAGFDPARKCGLVVLSNAGSGFGIYQRIVRESTGLDQLSFVANLHPKPPSTNR